ncbi:MAG: hypothetical protein LBI38_06425 [Oscillospiraceae bacterium]|jgi:hypothetical protein|nr:hypothetical protein [Oscillospiraceae bacterium]
MKIKVLTIILAAALIASLIACHSTIPENWRDDESDSADQTDVSDTSDNSDVTDNSDNSQPLEVKPPLTADDMYDTLLAQKSLWNASEYDWGGTFDGTLIDLDFDGIPEFIVTDNLSRMSIYRFGDDGSLIPLMEKVQLYYNAESFTELKSIIPYTDGDGAKKWLISYRNYVDYSDYSSWDSYYSLSAFDFTDGKVTETVKFNSIIYSNDAYDGETYYNPYGYEGYPFAKAEFYIDGVEYTASQDKLDEFWADMDRMILEYQNAPMDDGLYEHDYYLPWFCAGYYPTPTLEEWEELKVAFINRQLAAEPAYSLIPMVGGDNVWDHWEQAWYRDDDALETGLRRLVDNYWNGDADYFRTYDLFYSNGGAACKPVLYLYPEKVTDVDVNVVFPGGGYFTCTYPDYGDGWSVTAYPDGTVINKADGLEYSYLYWSSYGLADWDFSSGFVVKGEDTAAFLREKLAFLGLTPREYNEFIVYWLPLMQNNPYNLVAFQTDKYEESAVLRVSPKPDSLLRVFMAYMPLENPIDIPEQQLDSFERVGFSVVEWGGTCVR